jgi:hypothetical protein
VDTCLEPRVRRRLPQGFRKHGNRKVIVLELREEKKSFGTHRAHFCRDQQIVDDRSRTCPFARDVLRTRRRKCTYSVLVALIRRRQPKCVLRELGRKSRCAAICSESRGVVERGGNRRVGRLRRQREVTGMEERLIDGTRNTLVEAVPLLS